MARNLGARGVQPLGTSPTHPQIQQESDICVVVRVEKEEGHPEVALLSLVVGYGC